MLFLNRRGYAPTLLCTACGWIAPCRECDARLTVHLSAARLRCHHCGTDLPLPPRCPQCGFAVKAVVDQVLSAFGSVDVLVCNAGTNVKNRSLESL